MTSFKEMSRARRQKDLNHKIRDIGKKEIAFMGFEALLDHGSQREVEEVRDKVFNAILIECATEKRKHKATWDRMIEADNEAHVWKEKYLKLKRQLKTSSNH